MSIQGQEVFIVNHRGIRAVYPTKTSGGLGVQIVGKGEGERVVVNVHGKRMRIELLRDLVKDEAKLKALTTALAKKHPTEDEKAAIEKMLPAEVKRRRQQPARLLGKDEVRVETVVVTKPRSNAARETA